MNFCPLYAFVSTLRYASDDGRNGMILPMKKEDWEQDIFNRQRNIVFPDTVLNEGRPYRNIFSRGAKSHRAAYQSGILRVVHHVPCIFRPGKHNCRVARIA